MGSKSNEYLAIQSLNPEDGILNSSYRVSGVFIKKKSPIYTSKRICELVDVSTDKKNSMVIKSKYGGTITNIFIKVGDVISVGNDIVEIEVCRHPTVLGSLCCNCGALLEDGGAYVEMKKESKTLVSMVHTIPDLKVSKQEAQRLGSLDIQNLINMKKLVLLVDLDQTLVHTTNDNVPPKLKDVYHFQLMKNGPWYHTRLRPYAKKFLQSIAKIYELHICTFGVREYAHYIAHFLDKDRKLFGTRILSRNECLDPMSKKANLSSLFPCGDNLVCIIDDRSDVWHSAPNVVQVIPYHFFKHTGDINAPPGLQKKEDDERKGFDFTKIVKRASSVESSDGEDCKSSSSSRKTSCSESDTNMEEIDKIIEEESESKTKKEEDKVDSSEDEIDSSSANESKDIPVPENEVNSVPENEVSSIPENEVSSIPENEVNSIPENEVNSIPENEVNSIPENEVSPTPETKVESEISSKVLKDTDEAKDVNGSLLVKEGSHIDALEAVVNTCSDNAKGVECQGYGAVLDSDSHDSNSVDMTLNSTFDNHDENEDGEIINVTDCDDYLLYLEDVLTRLHHKFYSLYEENKEILPDLKNIVPEIRSRVLKGVNIVFSGVLPQRAELKTSKAYHIATSLGATVSENIVVRPKNRSKENTDQLYTTHLVAAKLHTEKCHKAQNGNIKIVTPNWLWCCAERWEHCDERIFYINSESENSVIRNPPMHCIFTKQQKEQFKGGKPMKRANDNGFPTPILDDINPLAFLSNDETKKMEEEVDNLLSDMEDEDKDKESVSTLPSSSSDSSLSDSGSCTNPKRKRQRTDENSDNNTDDEEENENDDDELPSIRFRQGGALPSDDSVNNSDDEDMNAFGDILERELMG